jgi:hypothetical protein
MSNEEIIKHLAELRNLGMFERALEAAIARLSAPARTEWVVEFRYHEDHWCLCGTRTNEDAARELLAAYRKNFPYRDHRAVERELTETVKDW